ncbi:MAG TPA: pentapeptide repeat-containing protein [Acidobacteria bacterium]|nr:pentapeptide repeat-containing protein [Acidobacteriota bacterium]
MALSATKTHCALLREEKIDEFNVMARSQTPDLVNANLRSVDLRQAHLKRADLRGAYLRGADLRGVDLPEAQLDGASLHHAQVGGVLFPPNLPAEEIRLSVQLGTRMRCRPEE